MAGRSLEMSLPPARHGVAWGSRPRGCAAQLRRLHNREQLAQVQQCAGEQEASDGDARRRNDENDEIRRQVLPTVCWFKPTVFIRRSPRRNQMSSFRIPALRLLVSPVRLASVALCLLSLAGCGARAKVGQVKRASASSADGYLQENVWELQLPSGYGNTIDTVGPDSLADYSDDYYYTADDGGQIFMDPQTGITSSGSKHPRTELRELDSDGNHVAWSASGTNTLTVTGQVLQVGGDYKGRVTLGQVYNSDDSIPLFELEYSSAVGGFVGVYEEVKGGSSGVIDLSTPVDLYSQYTFSLDLSNNALTVTINGNQVYCNWPSDAVINNGFYFKAGAYDQTATAGPVSTDVYTEIENYNIDVLHQ
jgi:hypothetical protein